MSPRTCPKKTMTKMRKSVEIKDPEPSPPHSVNVNVDLNPTQTGTTECGNIGSSGSSTAGSATGRCSSELDINPVM